MRVAVTGGANGIGKKLCIMLLERGHEVRAIDRDVEALEKLDRDIETVEADVSEEEGVEKALNRFEPEVLVNCAGVQERGAVEDMDLQEFRDHIETNYLGTVSMTKQALPSIRRNNGRIINISSIAGKTSAPYLSAYSASKHAVEGFSDSLRMELNDSEVDVVVVEPGPIQTGFNRSAVMNLRRFVPESRFSDIYSERIDEESEKERAKTEAAARKVLKAVEAESPSTRYTVTRIALMVRYIKPFMPDRWWDRMVLSGY